MDGAGDDSKASDRKRKYIQFVRESSSSSHGGSNSATRPIRQSHTIYESIVLSKKKPQQTTDSTTASNSDTPADVASITTTDDEAKSEFICPVCNLAVGQAKDNSVARHEASLAHQVCLEPSHAPVAVDRTRRGFAYLNSYGWEPEERVGLGARGEGRLYAIQPRKKEGREGIGTATGSDSDEFPNTLEKKKKKKPDVAVTETLDAAGMQKQERERRRKDRKMQNLFFGNDDVNKYLGIQL